MNGVYLTLNAGSSSLKFALFDSAASSADPLLKGTVAGVGGTPAFTARGADGAKIDTGVALDGACDHAEVIARLLPWLAAQHAGRPLLAVGHRVVHGGQHFTAPTRITPVVLAQLQDLAPLAPLHQHHNLAAIRAVAQREPDVPQIACFDTSFHRTQSHLAQEFALPRTLTDQGIIRYGFHGLSYDYIASTLPEHLQDGADGRVVVAHLGNGSSMCALQARKSVATTMGFTALDGLMMGSRCGTLDPGVILHLIQHEGMRADEIETLLYTRSGLLGVSGTSNDMYVLQNTDTASAREAIDMFCYRAACGLAGLVPSIGGLDALVFTAGIGENSALVRTKICGWLDWLGVSLDDVANDRAATVISAATSRVKVLVIPTNEEAVVARACRALVR